LIARVGKLLLIDLSMGAIAGTVPFPTEGYGLGGGGNLKPLTPPFLLIGAGGGRREDLNSSRGEASLDRPIDGGHRGCGALPNGGIWAGGGV